MIKKILTFLLFLFTCFVVYYIAFDNYKDPGQARKCECVLALDSSDNINYSYIHKALLASRFNSIEELKSVVHIKYYHDPSDSVDADGYSKVRLTHCSNQTEVSSVLESGISQGDIYTVIGGSILDKAWFLMKSPFAVAKRSDLMKVFNLARRKPYTYGEGDIAFYDLALASVNNIQTKELAYRTAKDSSELGYINSFNHITAQAFMTSCFSESLADFIADVHERHNMAELTTGRFTKKQLSDSYNNPRDNYVDMINNEWGQELGKQLKEKYNISTTTYWTPLLLRNYLNDLQDYYSKAFQIGFRPFRADDKVVIKFVNKINVVMKGKAP